MALLGLQDVCLASMPERKWTEAYETAGTRTCSKRGGAHASALEPLVSPWTAFADTLDQASRICVPICQKAVVGLQI